MLSTNVVEKRIAFRCLNQAVRGISASSSTRSSSSTAPVASTGSTPAKMGNQQQRRGGIFELPEAKDYLLTAREEEAEKKYRRIGAADEVTDDEMREIYPANLLMQDRYAADAHNAVKRPHVWIDRNAKHMQQKSFYAGGKARAEADDEMKAEGKDEGEESTKAADEVDENGPHDAVDEDSSNSGPSRSASSSSITSEELTLHDMVPRLSDVGKFERFSRDELLDLMPEGLCGELSRDIILVPSQSRDVGIMLRKASVEILSQMHYMQKDLLHSQEVGKTPLMSSKPGWLLEGKKGCGKSTILNYVVMWARRNNWLVIYEPFLANYAKDKCEIQRSSNTGVYIQNAQSRKFLERTLLKNLPLFQHIPVDNSIYGKKRGLDGEPISKSMETYDKLIGKAVDRDLQQTSGGNPVQNEAEGVENDEEADEDEEEFIDPIEYNRKKLRSWKTYRDKVKIPSLTMKLTNPESLYDIVRFGINNEVYATQVVQELFEQLKVQTSYPVLVAVDEWNEGFPISDYVSARYDRTRFGGYIPSYHLSMVRPFIDFYGLGSGMKNGLCLYSTSWYRMNRRDWRPELLKVPAESIKTVRNFSPHEFANYCAYLRLQNVTHNFPKDKLDYFWMVTQGNGWHARRIMSMLY